MQRLHSLDVIRGSAVLGILLMNIYDMTGPSVGYSTPTWRTDVSWLDWAIFALQSFFIEGRFISLFALLFGAGLMLAQQNWQHKGIDAKAPMRQRLWWLLLFGALHGTLL